MNLLPEEGSHERKFKVDLCLTPAQKIIDASPARFKHVRAGRKFGKTVYTMKKILDWLGPPGSVVWYISPTYRQGRLISWSQIKRMIPQEAFAKKPNDQDMMITLKNGSELYYMGSDDPDSLRGPAPTGVIFEEAAYHKPEAWYNVVEPNLSVHKAPAIFVSTPRGFNWFKDLEDEAKRLIGEGKTEWATFHFTTYDNPHISREEIDRIKNSLDPMVWNQEYMAEYESAVGRVFNIFQDNTRHVAAVNLPAGVFDAYRGIDWGMRDNTGCVWGFVRDGRLFVYREHAQNGLSPAAQGSIIKEKTTPKENIVGNALSHDAAKQDAEMRGLTVFWHFQNSGIRPLRLSTRDKKSSRAMLQQLFSEDRIVVDLSCRKLRKQLLMYEWKDTTMEKTEDGNDDLVDALHYLVELLQTRLFLTGRSEKVRTIEEVYADIKADKEAQKIRRYKTEEPATSFDFHTEGTAAGYL